MVASGRLAALEGDVATSKAVCEQLKTAQQGMPDTSLCDVWKGSCLLIKLFSSKCFVWTGPHFTLCIALLSGSGVFLDIIV